jgi:hypothetical protein
MQMINRLALDLVYFLKNGGHQQPGILQILDTGFRNDFISRPFRSTDPGICSMSQKMEAVCNMEVSSLLRKKTISVASDIPGFLSKIFTIPKKYGAIDQ